MILLALVDIANYLYKEIIIGYAAPVNVFIGGEKKKMSAMEVKDMWGEM